MFRSLPPRHLWSLCLLASSVFFPLHDAIAQRLPTPADATKATTVTASSDAQKLYAAAKADLLQIRVLTRGSNSRSSVGSGFIIGEGPYIVTNYHVISRLALEPNSYDGQYITTDKRDGRIELIAIDVARDLAIVKADIEGSGFFTRDKIAKINQLQQGEKLFSLGNPLDLGFSITEGNYNGTSNRGFFSTLMYTGAVNSGMSGGPTINSRGELAGINVAARRDGELVSFLVPAEYLERLLDEVERNPEPPSDFRPVIAKQLVDYQDVLTAKVLESPFNLRKLGNFDAPVRDSEQMRCWGGSNTTHKSISSTSVRCSMESRVFVSNDIQIGYLDLQHQLIKNKNLNSMKFAKVREMIFDNRVFSTAKDANITSAICNEDFVDLQGTPARVLLCAEAYHNFPGIYDMTFDAITLDTNETTLLSSMQLFGISYENGLKLAQEFMTGIARRTDSVSHDEEQE
ncbi:MAG: S1C family serine protease [Cellvibrio sp.]